MLDAVFEWYDRDQARKVDPCLFRIEGCGGPEGVAGRCPGCAAEKDSPGLYTDRDSDQHQSCLSCDLVNCKCRTGKVIFVPLADQALSAPTAESGKDSACYCNQYQSSDIPCPPGKCPNVPPAPVAEAPERVTHEEVRKIAHHWAGKRTADILLRYAAQQEQSEREVAELRRKAEVSDMWKRCSDDTQKERDSYKRLLTDANLKAEGLRADNEELKAKLAESERKLGEQKTATERLWKDCDCLPGWKALNPIGEHNPRCDMHPSETEPAGVEAGKVPRPGRDCPNCGPGCRFDEDGCCGTCGRDTTTSGPTPTEPEAPARFRVGQRVKRAANITNGDGTVTRLVRNEIGFNNWVKWDNGGECNYQDRDLEPADPAPPKPGADPLAKLVDALRAIRGNYGGATYCFIRDLIGQLEREGGGKS